MCAVCVLLAIASSLIFRLHLPDMILTSCSSFILKKLFKLSNLSLGFPQGYSHIPLDPLPFASDSQCVYLIM